MDYFRYTGLKRIIKTDFIGVILCFLPFFAVLGTEFKRLSQNELQPWAFCFLFNVATRKFKTMYIVQIYDTLLFF